MPRASSQAAHPLASSLQLPGQAPPDVPGGPGDEAKVVAHGSGFRGDGLDGNQGRKALVRSA